MKMRKTVDVRYTRFCGGGTHWYLRMKTTGKELNDVFPLKVLAEAEAERQLKGQFKGLKPRVTVDDYSNGQGEYFKHLQWNWGDPLPPRGEISGFMKLYNKARELNKKWWGTEDAPIPEGQEFEWQKEAR